MPQKNVVKLYEPNTFYHVYNHAVPKESPLADDSSKLLFMRLISRYLAGGEKDARGMAYADLSGKVKLLAYCLMSNHFHLLLYQQTTDGVTDLMRRVITAFVKLTNETNGRRGTLFETAFKGAKIENDAYLAHIVRYIHLNPLDAGEDYKNYNHSSYQDYAEASRFGWLDTAIVLSIFNEDRVALSRFTEDGVTQHLTRK